MLRNTVLTSLTAFLVIIFLTSCTYQTKTNNTPLTSTLPESTQSVAASPQDEFRTPPLTKYDPSFFDQPVKLNFTTQNLMRQELAQLDAAKIGEIVQTVAVGTATQIMYSLYNPLIDMQRIYSCLESDGTYYALNLCPDSLYDALLIEETAIESPNPVYALNITRGANYVQRQYLSLENGIPYLIAQIDCAKREVDLDGDGFSETISSYGIPIVTVLYVWSISDNTVSYSILNDELNSTSVVYDVSDDRNVFVSMYYDTSTETARDIILEYSGGTLVRRD